MHPRPLAPTRHTCATRLGALATCALALAMLQGCAVASATAGAAVSVVGAVASTGITLTGKAVGAGIDALAPASEPPDRSGIVVRERITDEPRAAPLRCAPPAGEGDGGAQAAANTGAAACP